MTKRGREHGPARRVVDKVQDALGGVAGKAKAKAVRSADAFVENVAIGDLYEIAAARIAVKRASSPEVRAFALRMIEDHHTLSSHLHAALEMNETSGVKAPPKELDARRRAMIEHLEAAPDDQLDAMYVDQQRLARSETVSLLRTYRDDGDNAQLRSVAAGALPVVERHLTGIEAIQAAR